MTRKYKQTIAVKAVMAEIDRYLEGMALAGKEPSTILLRKKEFDLLVDDENKYLASVQENPVKVTVPADIKGFTVSLFQCQ